MVLPPLPPLGISTIIYLLLFYVLVVGIWDLVKINRGQIDKGRILWPLGAAAVVFGIISMVNQYRTAFLAIEEAGDISPSIVASAFRDAYDNPTLGLLCLAMAFVFTYLNRR